MAQKIDNRFFALIIPDKDLKPFFDKYPELWDELTAIGAKYGRYRTSTGRKFSNKYIIVNQDEPYAKKVWQVVLDGETAKGDIK